MEIPNFLRQVDDIGVVHQRRPSELTTGKTAPGGPLAISLPAQALSEWCWAATTSGVKRYYGEPDAAEQCVIATTTLGWDCCPPGRDEPRNPNNLPYDLATALGPNLAAPPMHEPLGWAALAAEIDAKRPVACAVQWRRGGNLHFNVVAGYTQNGDVIVRDPKYLGDHYLPYSTFKDAYMDRGSWHASLRTKRVAR